MSVRKNVNCLPATFSRGLHQSLFPQDMSKQPFFLLLLWKSRFGNILKIVIHNTCKLFLCFANIHCIFKSALALKNVTFILFIFFRLCVASLLVNNFCDNREAVYGVFDGERNAEVPSLLQCTMCDILADELQKTKSEEEYMGNTFLVMQR